MQERLQAPLAPRRKAALFVLGALLAGASRTNFHMKSRFCRRAEHSAEPFILIVFVRSASAIGWRLSGCRDVAAAVPIWRRLLAVRHLRPRRAGRYHRRMFSYRHAFHAGNHGDVLKHAVLVAVLRHLMRKPGRLTLIDTHAGAGMYQLGGGAPPEAREADAGILRLQRWWQQQDGAGKARLPELVRQYLELVAGFNPSAGGKEWSRYPGSPAILHALMEQPERIPVRDRLLLFEMHPTDIRLLAAHVAGLDARQRVRMEHADGFAALARVLPPPADAGGSRRALALIDPSYEMKTDYGQVERALAGALRRFATGVYVVWYPVIERREAERLPARLQQLAVAAGRPWLNAVLDVGAGPVVSGGHRPLHASGVWVINSPRTLAPALRAALPLLQQVLAQGAEPRWLVRQGG